MKSIYYILNILVLLLIVFTIYSLITISFEFNQLMLLIGMLSALILALYVNIQYEHIN